MKRRTFISLMSVMAAAGVLTLAGCSSNSGSSAAASGARLRPPLHAWSCSICRVGSWVLLS